MVTSSYPKFPGDVTAPFIESIACGVAQLGHQVDVVLPHHPGLRRGDDEPVRFYPYRYVPFESWNVWGYAQSLNADVRVRRAAYFVAPLAAAALRQIVGARMTATSYDAVHVHWVVPNAVAVRDIVRSHRAGLVVSLHGSDVFMARSSRMLGRSAAGVFDHAGAITACSRDLHEKALELGAPPARTRTVPYGVDVHAFRPDAPGVADVRARLGVGPETFLVLAVGRLVEKKGFAHLIEAAAKTGGIQLVVAGEGDLRSALEQQAREQNAPVRFAGALDRGTVAAAYAAADVVAVPSVVDAAGNVDGLPNTLLEGLASGRPVVASRVAGIPDVVDDDRNGLLVPPGDSGALAVALRRLVREPETRDRLATEARRDAVARLSWEATARTFDRCYAEAAALAAR